MAIHYTKDRLHILNLGKLLKNTKKAQKDKA